MHRKNHCHWCLNADVIAQSIHCIVKVKKKIFNLCFLFMIHNSQVTWGAEAAPSEPLSSSGDPYRTRGVLTLKPAAGNQHHTPCKLIGVSFTSASQWTVCCLKAQLEIFPPHPLFFFQVCLSAQPKTVPIAVKQECFDPFTAIRIEASGFNWIRRVQRKRVYSFRALPGMLLSKQNEALLTFLFHENLSKLSNVSFYLDPNFFFFHVSFDKDK